VRCEASVQQLLTHLLISTLEVMECFFFPIFRGGAKCGYFSFCAICHDPLSWVCLALAIHSLHCSIAAFVFVSLPLSPGQSTQIRHYPGSIIYAEYTFQPDYCSHLVDGAGFGCNDASEYGSSGFRASKGNQHKSDTS
jgi:hypothetical protein